MRSVPWLALLALSAALSATPDSAPAFTLRVLFVGNSLTYSNDLPATVERVAVAAGGRIVTGAVTAPGAALEDHWRAGTALQAIRAGGWDVVVLQQGPSSLPDNRRTLRQWTRRFARPIRAAGARPALLMVWPSVSRGSAFDGVRAAYAAAAEAVDGILLPAGEAWRTARERSPELALYGPDGFHPSRLGTLLAALVVVERLTGRLPADPSVALPGLDAATSTLLLESARAAGHAR